VQQEIPAGMTSERSIGFGSEPRLAGRIGIPENPRALVVFSHPHTLYGGTMSNNVVRQCCHFLREEGFATFRFDFRGAGKSGGSFDNGRGEQDDLAHAVQEAVAQSGGALPLVLIGYSFGSWVTWAVLDRLTDTHAVILISPPFGMDDYDWKPRPELTSLAAAIIGDQDHICPPSLFNRSIGKLTPGIDHQMIHGIDHFWQSSEKDLTSHLVRWIDSALI
jgi:alpha/beta superfamily hydrolase